MIFPTLAYSLIHLILSKVVTLSLIFDITTFKHTNGTSNVAEDNATPPNVESNIKSLLTPKITFSFLI